MTPKCGNKHTESGAVWLCSRPRELDVKPFHEGPHHGKGGPDNLLITWTSKEGE